ncbi:MAG: selenocysteine-specific translation elongation factor [bacterium]|nr:selenocysteine-specific translation elongation factor [bacterium]
MPIVATAGHVDHGKSTLVEALTGRDPDRWAEEKERGLTIDLGFAWRRLGGLDVGFVDVPGHERFIKNMLAGVGALDVALFVVAADEGWMPQSEEHLAILDMIDTRHGVVALTRVDLADADAADLAELEILEAVEGTTLSNWPVIRVSAVTGYGMEDLENALIEQLEAAGPPVDRHRPRLWIDRAFHISGAGRVVTGTLAGGSIAGDDELMLWPGAVPVRVRGMQHHDAPTENLTPGTRAALNLTGADDIGRGAMLGRPGSFRDSSASLATLRTVRSLTEDLTTRGAYHLHVGSGSWPVQMRIIETEGPNTVCLLRTAAPIPLQSGDRFILRETGRKAVVGGGVVLDPHPPSSSAAIRDAAPILLAAAGSGPDSIADALLTVRGTASATDLGQDSGGGEPSSSFTAGGDFMSAAAAAGLLTSIAEAVAGFHRENRLRTGLPKAELSSLLAVSAESVAMVVAGSKDLVDDGAIVRSREFEPGLSDAEQEAWEAAQRELQRALAVPRASQLGLDNELLHALIRDGRLSRVGDDLVYLPDQIEEIKQLLGQLTEEFTVAEFRDAIGVTRRQAVPLLEWFDKNGVTIRRGDVRALR